MTKTQLGDRSEQLLRRAVSLLAEVGCQATGCYVDTGHRPSCLRGRAEKLGAEIDDHLAHQRVLTEDDLFGAYREEAPDPV